MLIHKFPLSQHNSAGLIVTQGSRIGFSIIASKKASLRTVSCPSQALERSQRSLCAVPWLDMPCERRRSFVVSTAGSGLYKSEVIATHPRPPVCLESLAEPPSLAIAAVPTSSAG